MTVQIADRSIPVPAPQLLLNEPIAPQLYRALRTAILTLRLKPGQALSEAEISRLYKVSRQPVREAFIKLAEAGLVVVRPQRGTFVVKISLRDVMNARFVREAVEVAVVRLASDVADSSMLPQLRGLIAEQRRVAQADDWSAFLSLDEAFHRAIAESAGCAYAWRVIDSIKAQMDRVRFLSFRGASPLPLLIAQHEDIVAAMERRDGAAAETAMCTHLREILKVLPDLAAAHPDLFDEHKADDPAGIPPQPKEFPRQIP